MSELTNPTSEQMREAFEDDMAAAGWTRTEVFNVHPVYVHGPHRRIAENKAYDHWLVTFETPTISLPDSVTNLIW